MKNFKEKLLNIGKKPATKVVAVLLALIIGILIGLMLRGTCEVQSDVFDGIATDQIEDVESEESISNVLVDETETQTLPTLIDSGCTLAQYVSKSEYAETYQPFVSAFLVEHPEYNADPFEGAAYSSKTGSNCLLSDGTRLITFAYTKPSREGLPEGEIVGKYPVVDQSVVWFAPDGTILNEVDGFNYVNGDIEAPHIYSGVEDETEIQLHFGQTGTYHQVYVLSLEDFSVELIHEDIPSFN